EVLYVLDKRVDFIWRIEGERRHGRAGNAVVEHAMQIFIGWLSGRVRAFELEDAGTIVARIRVEDRGSGAVSVAIDAVAMDTVAAVETALFAGAVTPHWAGGHIELPLIEAGLGHSKRLIGRAEHRVERVGDDLLIVPRNPLGNHLSHVEPKRRRIAL